MTGASPGLPGPILRRSSRRYFFHHPWQLGLAVAGIALGVAVVVSIDLANRSASRAFALSTEAVTGRTTHQIVGGPEGIPEKVYRRWLLGAPAGSAPAAPVVEAYVALDREPPQTFRLLGVDPFAEVPFGRSLAALQPGAPGDGPVDLTTFLTRPGALLLSAATARELGLAVGDPLPLVAAGRRQEAFLAGTLAAGSERRKRALADVLLVDLATAQELLHLEGHLSRIDLVAPEEARAEAATLERWRALLPPGTEILPAAARAGATAGMTRAFELNLRALALLALVCGTFLVFNTVSFSVVQRRPLLGTLRALGVTRRQILALVLGEALVLGVAGSVLGAALGVFLGRGLVGLVTRTINDLYFVVSVRELTLSWESLVLAFLLGVGASLVAALGPAREATTAPPREVLHRSALEERSRARARLGAVLGLLLALAGAALLVAAGHALVWNFAGLFALILGCALMVPRLTVLLMALLRPPLAALFGLLGSMAGRGVVASLSRTAVAIAALTVAVSVTVGVGVMVDSFRATLVRWLETTLAADVYVSAAGPGFSRGDASLPPELRRRLEALPGVASSDSVRSLRLLSTGWEDPEETTAVLEQLVVIDSGPRGRGGYRFLEGNPEEAWAAFDQGAVLLSEPYAFRRDLAPGDQVTLPTAAGPRSFPVAGVYASYGSDQGAVLLARAVFERHWNDRRLSGVALHLEPGADADEVVSRVRRSAGADLALTARSNRDLKRTSLEIFDRTFLITGVLRLLAGAVAFLGVLSALMALALERTREIGVLRATGLTPKQVWRLTLGQTGLMGLAAGLLALPLGLALAAAMIFFINRRSFGWTLELQVDPAILLQALVLSLLAALLAGIYPAWRMARIPPAAALRDE